MSTETKNFKATVDVGEALNEIDKLKKRTEELKKAYQEAQMKGDTKAMKQIQKEIKATEKETKEFQRSLSSVDSVLRRLDKSTLKEMQTALQQAQKELRNARRGTEEFAAASAKVKKLETAISQVRSEAGLAQKSFGGSGGFLSVLKGGFTSLLGPIAAVTGAFAGIRSAVSHAVDAVAKMDAAMTDARQYTGMTTDEIKRLNEEFQKMDTRTSREQLNKLAADAGRLGKNTVEDVLGYVRAANMVNIALKDLGSDATLTLTKLAGVFGVETEKGTEQALLSIGSAITEMANSCAASAGGVAEFTSRLGGVGAQAGLSLAQITAMGAVFENSGVSIERSSTAMQKLISDLTVNTEKIANAAGIQNIKEFSRLVKTDMNSALLVLFDTLNKNGSFANLAPIFADMGERGSGVIQTLATMASKVDFLREQQTRATAAFEQGTAVIDAYNIQNNTVEAQLERNKKALNEVWVALGEELKPAIAESVGLVTQAVSVIKTLVHWCSEAVKGYIALAEKTDSWSTVLKLHITPISEVTNSVKDLLTGLIKVWDTAKSAYQWAQDKLGVGGPDDGKANGYGMKVGDGGGGTIMLPPVPTNKDEDKSRPIVSVGLDGLGDVPSSAGGDDRAPRSAGGTTAVQEDGLVDALKQQLAELKAQYDVQKVQYKQMLVDETLTQQEYLDKMKQAETDHLAQVALLYVEGSDEREEAELKHCEALLNYQLWLRQEEQKLQEKKNKEEESRQKEEEKRRQEENEKLLKEEQELAEQRKQQQEAVAQVMFSTFAGALSSASQYISASMQADVAKVESEYDKQIEQAEGNKTLQEQLEQEKQKKIAGIKAKANKKQTSIQIMQAIASTAQAAIEAYKSMAGIPVVGPALGAVAAAAAVAFGGVQIASIKKQAAAQEAQGFARGGLVRDYDQGGFTRKGQKYEPVGTVHAGEYVVPQELVNDPDIAPISGNSDLQQLLAELNERLKQPLVARVTVTGDYGIEQAWNEYNRYTERATK